MSLPARRRRSARGFTLIELLVSIAIISILISILLPAVSGARRAGRSAVCLTHLRSCGQAMQLYANDYDAEIPLGISATMHFTVPLLPGLGYQSPNALGELYRFPNEAEYLKLCGTFPSLQCPDFPNDDQPVDYVVNSFLNPYPFGEDPGQHGSQYTAQDGGEGNQQMFLRLTRMRHSSGKYIYLTEAHKALPTDQGQFHDLFRPQQLPFGQYPRIADDQRHRGGINSVFFDSHAETMRHQNLDVGWPHSARDRLRFFTSLPTP